jgi:hypothetical protein
LRYNGHKNRTLAVFACNRNTAVHGFTERGGNNQAQTGSFNSPVCLYVYPEKLLKKPYLIFLFNADTAVTD